MFAALLLAAAGCVLLVAPGWLYEQYERADALGPFWGAAYLVAIGLGALLLIAEAIWLVGIVVRNTRTERAKRHAAARSTRDLGLHEKAEALDANLAEARALAEHAGAGETAEAIEESAAGLEAKLRAETLEIVAFGTISSGKSSVLNALAGDDLFATDVRGGTTRARQEIPWPGRDRVVLVDTPGLGEVQGGDHARLARSAAKDADLVLFVVDAPLKDFEHRTLSVLSEMEKRILVCLNKEDWYVPEDRERLLAQIRAQVAAFASKDDVVAVRARAGARARVRRLADGSEHEETVEVAADIAPLAQRMVRVLDREGKDLLLANLLLRSRGMVAEAKAQMRSVLDARARTTIDRATWRAAGAVALTPIPALDVAVGLGFTTKLVLDLARVYRQRITAAAAERLVLELGRNLVATVGASTVAPVLGGMIGSALKAVPGIGTISGGLLQGLSQAVVIQWIGRVAARHFRDEMVAPPGGLAQIARDEWDRLTSPSELLNLARTGLERLREERP